MLRGRFALTLNQGAEALLTAIEALSRRDGLTDATAGQRRADALVELAEPALRHGELPEHGGQRPQISYVLPADWAARQGERDRCGACTSCPAHRPPSLADTVTAGLPGQPGIPAEHGCGTAAWTGPATRPVLEALLGPAGTAAPVAALNAPALAGPGARPRGHAPRSPGRASRPLGGAPRPPGWCAPRPLGRGPRPRRRGPELRRRPRRSVARLARRPAARRPWQGWPPWRGPRRSAGRPLPREQPPAQPRPVTAPARRPAQAGGDGSACGACWLISRVTSQTSAHCQASTTAMTAGHHCAAAAETASRGSTASE